MNFEIIVRQVEKGKVIKEFLIKEIQVSEPKSIMDIGFRHSEQVGIISSIQDSYIPLQCKLLFTVDTCPKCGNKPMRNGTHTVSFHSSLSDHKIKAQGYSCSCGWQSRPTVHGIFGSNVHPDLIKTQATLGAKMPYKDAQLAITEFNCSKRSVNNHVKIAEATNKVGEILHEAKIKEEVIVTNESKELYLHVDGGHIRDKIQDKRSFEAMISTVFQPESYRKISDEKAIIENKHISASALSDNGSTINNLTIKAAQKEGMSKNTKITAFCDGAANCWSVVDSLAPYCKEITRILDWFHIRQAYDKAVNLLPEYKEQIDASKYKVWHGKAMEGVEKLKILSQSLINKKYQEQKINKIESIISYLSNNIDKLVNYMFRKNNDLPYTSNVAEANVESQINARFKRKQKMQWNRENAHNVLQVRSVISSNEWSSYQTQIDAKLAA
jgi:hypothetical protein